MEGANTAEAGVAPATRSSLQARWTALLVAFGLVPVVALAVMVTRIQRGGLARAEKELQVAVVDQATAILDGELDRVAEVTARVGHVLGEGRITDDDVRLELAQAALSRAERIELVAIYGPDGALLDAIRHAGGAEAAPPPKHLMLPAPGLRATESGELQWIEPIGRADEHRGWALGRISADKLDAAINDLSEVRFGARDRVAVVDGRLRVVAGAPRGASLAGKEIFASVSLSGATFDKSFGLTTELDGPGGERLVETVRTLPSHGWAVVVRRPEAEAFAALTASRRAFYGAAGVVALVAIALGAWSARRTTKPVNDLVRLTRAYARRDFAARSTVRTGDEIQVLGDSLTQMADNLAASEIEIARRATVEAGLSRFLPSEVAKEIAEGKADLSLGGQRRPITVVFADVASFTTFAEGAPPEKVVAFLNDFFTVLSEVTFRHGGMVDKFMGDCLMAIFGATGDGSDHAKRGVAAAEDMHRFIEASAPAWLETYGVDVKIGIGVASGDAVVGNLGSDRRMEFTAIGDAVNVAARLEALARPGQTLLTAETALGAGDAFEFHALGDRPLRGKRNAVTVLELVG